MHHYEKASSIHSMDAEVYFSKLATVERMGDDIVKQRRELHEARRERREDIEQVCLLDTMLYLEDYEGDLAYTDEEL